MPDFPRRDLASRHLPLSPAVFQILLSLCDRDLHGYAIIQEIRARTGGEVDLTASTLYAAVKRLLDAHLIQHVKHREAGDDPRRRYYRITPLGLDVARRETARLERVLRIARGKRLSTRRA